MKCTAQLRISGRRSLAQRPQTTVTDTWHSCLAKLEVGQLEFIGSGNWQKSGCALLQHATICISSSVCFFPNPLLLPGGDPGVLGSNPVSPPGRGEGLGKI
eukprot:6455128-Amphidinium_carterae.1